jgi:hypothetical protein
MVNRGPHAIPANKIYCASVDVKTITNTLIHEGCKGLFKTLLLLLFFPFYLSAQQATTPVDDITACGKVPCTMIPPKKTFLMNSPSVEVDGKLTGYSYTLFDIDGKKRNGRKEDQADKSRERDRN